MDNTRNCLFLCVGTKVECIHVLKYNVAHVQFRPGVICGLSLLLVLVLARRFFLRVLRFSSLHKHSKFQFDQDGGSARKPTKADVASSLCINVLIYYLNLFNYCDHVHSVITGYIIKSKC